MILPRNLIVMVVDGARMVLMRNQGDATDPQLTVIAHRECPPLPNRDLFSDAPGRTFTSHGMAGSAYDQGDPHTADERAFLVSALAELGQNITDDTPGIVIAADPLSLGFLRAHYPKIIADNLLAEFDKDLTAMPVTDIVDHLRQW